MRRASLALLLLLLALAIGGALALAFAEGYRRGGYERLARGGEL